MSDPDILPDTGEEIDGVVDGARIEAAPVVIASNMAGFIPPLWTIVTEP
jgi:hypothetical protein